MGRTSGETGIRVAGWHGGAWLGTLVAGWLLATLAAGPVRAQQVPKNLTLQDAIALAEHHNPGFLSTENDRGPADWKTAQAYAQLLPQVDAGGQAGYTAAGLQRSGTFILGSQSTDWYSSYYDLGVSWSFGGSTIFGLSSARANQRYTDANIDAHRFALATQVAQQYVAALQAKDAVGVARREVDYAEQNLKLVQTKVSSGAAAEVDAKQEQLQLGNARVTLIQARQSFSDARVALGQQIGVPLPDSATLASRFEVFEPEWSVDSLLSLALRLHPAVRAAVAKEHASVAAARQARSAYFPKLTARLDFSGYTQKALNSSFLIGQYQSQFQSEQQSCELFNSISAGLTQPLQGYPHDCSQYTLTPALRQKIIAQNNAFPFHFTRMPLTLSVGVSIPVFTGFSRQQQVAQASAAVDDAKQSLRQEKLTLRTELTQAYDALRADYQVVQIQRQNREAAREVLEQRRKQYALGATGVTILNLLDAQTKLSTADQGFLKALYDFHYNLIRLEAAVGRPLTPAETAGPGETGRAGGL